MPTISGVKRVQDTVFSCPFPSTFTEFRERAEPGIAPKFANELLLEPKTRERIRQFLILVKLNDVPHSPHSLDVFSLSAEQRGSIPDMLIPFWHTIRYDPKKRHLRPPDPVCSLP